MKPLLALLRVGAPLLMVAALPMDAEAGTPARKTEMTGVVNLNTATAAQLDMLPGVGEKAAKKIIEYRTKTPFARPEDLTRVKGFGPKKMDKLKGLITVTGATTLQPKGLKAPEEPAPAQGRAAPKK